MRKPAVKEGIPLRTGILKHDIERAGILYRIPRRRFSGQRDHGVGAERLGNGQPLFVQIADRDARARWRCLCGGCRGRCRQSRPLHAAGGSSNVGLTFYFWRDMLLPNRARKVVFLLDIRCFS